MSAPPIDITAGKPAPDIEVKEPLRFDFNVNGGRDAMEVQQLLATLDRTTLELEIAETAPGSHVRVVDQDRSYNGTLLERTADRVVLINSVCKEAVPGPDGHLQCKTSHTPIQSFNISSVTGFTAFSPPPPGFVAPDIAEDGRCITVADIVYKDGHSQYERYLSKPVLSSPGSDSGADEQGRPGRASLDTP